MTWASKPCQDCGKAKGPRQRNLKYCYTCGRARNKSRGMKAYFAHILLTYHLTEEQYWAIYNAQGGHCYLCQHGSGKSRKLSVDHDHRCCPGKKSCGQCVRGLLCLTCNRIVLGRAARDSAEFFERGIRYLTSPPAHSVIARVTIRDREDT